MDYFDCLLLCSYIVAVLLEQDKKKGVFVEGLSEWAVRSPNEVYSLM